MSDNRWRLWCFGFEKGNTIVGTNVVGVTANNTSPLRGSWDGDFFFNKDGDDNLLAYVRHTELFDQDGNDWASAFGSFVLTMPSSISNYVNLFQDISVDISNGNKLELGSNGKLTIRSGATTQEFTTVMSGGTDYRIAFTIQRGGFGLFAVRLYDSSDVLLEEQSLIGNGSVGPDFIFGMRAKESYTGTNANTHIFMDNCILYYTSEPLAFCPWITGDQAIHLATVDITTPPAPAHDDYVATPVVDKELNVDDISPEDGDSTVNESDVAIAGGKEFQTYPLNDGPSLSGDDVINGVMMGWRGRRTDVNARMDVAELNLYDGADDLYSILGLGNAYTGRSHGLLKRLLGGVSWDEASRNALEVGSACEVVGYDTVRDNVTHLTALPESPDGTDDGEWSLSTGGDAWALVDEDIPGSAADYIHTVAVGNNQDFNIATPTIPAGTLIVGVSVVAQFQNADFSADAVAVKMFYKDSVGTRHYSDAVTVGLLGTVTWVKFWDKDPEGDVVWTATKIGASEFGVESVSGGGTKQIRCIAFNVDINLRSNLRETSYWVNTVHGPRIVFQHPQSRMLNQAVQRAAVI